MESRTLDLPETFRQLGISRGHGYKRVRQRALPGVIRLGSRLRMSRAVLERILAGEETTETGLGEGQSQ
ncbi:MAG: hypothetical protein HY321_08775 [Armatimonadetes bacterium]|nr:hypothetical protein [Armatimonadota bacterium]